MAEAKDLHHGFIRFFDILIVGGTASEPYHANSITDYRVNHARCSVRVCQNKTNGCQELIFGEIYGLFMVIRDLKRHLVINYHELFINSFRT